MKIILLIAISMIVTSISIGTAMALIQQNDNVKVDGNFEVQRLLGPSAITVQNNNDFSNSIKIWDIDDSQIYLVRLIGTGDRLEIIDITNGRVGFSMLSSNGNVGIGTTTPTEALHVAGNIRLTGNVVSTGDICIGTCP